MKYCKVIQTIVLILLSASMAVGADTDSGKRIDTFSDTWPACDALGRKLPAYDSVGLPRKDKLVGMFYFLWHGPHTDGGPYDITKILAKDPEAMQKKDSPLWGPMHAPHHWGESIFGYYVSDDDYVLRKHAQMLSDAGVDFIVFDVTNQQTYRDKYMALLRVFSDIRKHGGNAPQVAFLCPFWSPTKVVNELYADLYGPGLYKDLWFRIDGKPLILADLNMVFENGGNDKQNGAHRLKPDHTIGQSFTATKPFISVGGMFVTWWSKKSAMTLTLYKDGPNGRKIMQKRSNPVMDNAAVTLRFDTPLPSGSYYLEMSDAKGKVGWRSHSDDVFPRGKAYVDGKEAKGDRWIMIGNADSKSIDISQFFTFRKPQPDYFTGPTGLDMWSWLEVYPQKVFKNSKGEKEMMSVGVAQNAVGGRLGCLSEKNSHGRSYNKGKVGITADSMLYGLNFAEQWEHALKLDPKIVFITGWNEWWAMRFDEFAGVKEPVMFVDQFDQEHSRDIEPMKGGHGDNYYYQLISYIRKFKGVRKAPVATSKKTIKTDDGFKQWADVEPEYRDDIGDTAHRNHTAFNNFTQYTNDTGRNDIVSARVTADQDNVYFYVSTNDTLTDPVTSKNWMLLLIDTDMDHTTGWNGYDYAINRIVKDQNGYKGSLERNQNSKWDWAQVGQVKLVIDKNEIQLAISRSDLNLMPGKSNLSFDFKWADNISDSGDIIDMLTNGDTAPNARFNYRFEATFK